MTEDAMARDESMLVGEANRLRYNSFVRVLDYWSHHVDRDGTEDKAAGQRDGRRFHLSQSFEGNWRLCDVPAEVCEIDHIEPWAAGGYTVTANGRPACGFHNRWRNRSP